ncbi:MAG TPA: 3-dehydroquinate synthase [Capsulimonadaceae bacterium]|nr:3-dehydroquinate synthase [Capsulimonadaceae bacterium]
MATQTRKQSTTSANRAGTRAVRAAAPKSKNGSEGSQSAAHVVHVDLGARSYDIHVERGLLDQLGPYALKSLGLKGDAGGRVAAVVVNPKVEHYHGKAIYQSLEAVGFNVFPIVLVAGECYKNLQAVRRIYGMLYEQAVDRRTVVVAVGGGVIGDVAGFVAATYLRGLDYIQVPTTLLAQVDSSVGGKVGVNFKAGKNLVGAFYQPRLVAIDPNTLHSLPFRERRSGLAEIIKYGAIADKPFFTSVSREIAGLLRLNSAYLETAIARSCQIKADVVEKDERDEGLRAILNFGHSVGHALEALTNYRVYRHGEAIAIGMVSACLIGQEIGITDPSVTDAISDVLVRAGFPIHLDDRIYPNDVIRLLVLDKKAVGGTVRFVLLERLGKATTGHIVPEDVVRSALQRQRRL